MKQEEYDHERTAFLQANGYKVLRFWNHDVMKDVAGVMRVILDALDEQQNSRDCA